MTDVIEPTAVIGPDGLLQTGWERPKPFPYESIADAIYGPLGRHLAYGAMVNRPFHVPLSGF